MPLDKLLYKHSLRLKVTAGLAETAAGLVLLVLTQDSLDDVTQLIGEIGRAHASAGHLATYINAALTGSRIVIAAYLLVHGVPKLLLGFALMRRKLWAYPVALASLAGFMVYQLYEVAYHHSGAMLALTILDIGIAILIWREYRSDRERLRSESKTNKMILDAKV